MLRRSPLVTSAIMSATGGRLWSVSGVLMQQVLGLGSEYQVSQSMVLYVLDACIETALSVPLQLGGSV